MIDFIEDCEIQGASVIMVKLVSIGKTPFLVTYWSYWSYWSTIRSLDTSDSEVTVLRHDCQFPRCARQSQQSVVNRGTSACSSNPTVRVITSQLKALDASQLKALDASHLEGRSKPVSHPYGRVNSQSVTLTAGSTASQSPLRQGQQPVTLSTGQSQQPAAASRRHQSTVSSSERVDESSPSLPRHPTVIASHHGTWCQSKVLTSGGTYTSRQVIASHHGTWCQSEALIAEAPSEALTVRQAHTPHGRSMPESPHREAPESPHHEASTEALPHQEATPEALGCGLNTHQKTWSCGTGTLKP
ncbi:hypothetical protein F5Y18DRAFT_425742 [Xylariaceae sp. FL1019]|nr:hypothetical protein F5Y18DRAFT_425742 [Xylariaceae sp. FL1019]